MHKPFEHTLTPADRIIVQKWFVGASLFFACITLLIRHDFVGLSLMSMATDDFAAISKRTAKPKRKAPAPNELAANSEETASPKRGRGPRKPFQKGQSGNPSGRPKQVNELVAIARGFSEEGLLKLAELVKAPIQNISEDLPSVSWQAERAEIAHRGIICVPWPR